MEVAIKQTELLQHNLRAFHPLRALVLVKLLSQISIHLIAGDELTLDAVLDGQFCVSADKAQNLIDGAKELLRLVLRHRCLRRRRRSSLSRSGPRVLLRARNAACHQQNKSYDPDPQTSTATAKSSPQHNPLNPPL